MPSSAYGRRDQRPYDKADISPKVLYTYDSPGDQLTPAPHLVLALRASRCPVPQVLALGPPGDDGKGKAAHATPKAKVELSDLLCARELIGAKCQLEMQS